MNWKIVSLLLSINYTSFVILSKIINKGNMSVMAVAANYIVIAAIFVLLFFRKHLRCKFDYNQLLLVIMALIALSHEYLIQYGNNLTKNFGVIDSLALSTYIPLITVIFIVFFKEKISKKKMVGIAVTLVGAYLLLT